MSFSSFDLKRDLCSLVIRSCAVSLALSFWAVGADAHAAPKDDHLLAIAGVAERIDPLDLMANDDSPGATWVLDEPPLYGQLILPPGTTDLLYDYVSGTVDGGRPFYGRDHFTYRLVQNGFSTAPITVYLTVQPRWIPITGDWLEDTTAPAGPGGGWGDSSEGGGDGDGDPRPAPPNLTGGMGFYNSEESYFRLCELIAGPLLTDCEDFALPTSVAQRGLDPLVGDWDDDGIDEVGVHNPATGKWLLFELQRSGCKAGGNCLVGVADLQFGNAGDRGLVGDWGTVGSVGDQFGIYEGASGWARLEPDFSSDPLGFEFEYSLGSGNWDEARPMAGQWNPGNWAETAAVHNPAEGKFYFVNSNVWPTVEVIIAETGLGTLKGGVGFPVTNMTGGVRYFGLFFEATDSVYLFATEDDHTGQVLVRVPTDPEG